MKDLIPGRVVRLQSGFYTVQTGQGRVICHLRGRLKKGHSDGDFITVGDRVQVLLHPGGEGSIEEIDERETALVRLAPTARGVYRQLLAANLDQVVLVFACANPEPHLRMLDRFLVICEKQGIPPVIVVNKVDLVGRRAAGELFGEYERIGYPVVYTSVTEHKGIRRLKERLVGRTSGLAGPSGVGKSSLLNAVQPELGLAVREISEAFNKGRHTTTVREMYALNDGGFVVDLPGLRQLSLWDTEPEELDGYFPELRDLVQHCQFNDCTHLDEPGCAVQQAVEAGRVSEARFESYLRMRFGDRLQFEMTEE
ncbi:MAG: ribosome small subunit-dependent GTPase A [Chloroflexi bacterium]|jgi:ribosome biogenesis GTPase|nr:ribosome small subunit-dependent GTPase A [Chloroflexota bacterium]